MNKYGYGSAGMGNAGTGKKNSDYELSTHIRVLPALLLLVPVLANVIPLLTFYWASTCDRHCIGTKQNESRTDVLWVSHLGTNKTSTPCREKS